MKHFLARPKGAFYPVDIHADNITQARKKAREMGLRTSEVWEFTEQAQKVVEESRRKMSEDYRKAGQIYDP